MLEPKAKPVAGWPWNTTAVIHFRDHADGQAGEVVYEYRCVIFAKAAWGKIRFYAVHEDTQKVAALDEYLAGRT